jgi:biopolymer transport protein ExbD
MARSKGRMSTEVNAGSMADIAFLLLIFFLVTTTIASDKGILNFLPPKQDPNVPPPDIKKNERNIFNVLINANNDLLVEGEYRRTAEGLDQDFKSFILNFGAPDEEAVALFNSLPASLQAQALRKADASDHPGEAVISIKTNRGTSYEVFLEVFDLAKKAYFEIYAERVGVTVDEYRKLGGEDEASKAILDKSKEGVPMAISIAEPDKIGGS